MAEGVSYDNFFASVRLTKHVILQCVNGGDCRQRTSDIGLKTTVNLIDLWTWLQEGDNSFEFLEWDTGAGRAPPTHGTPGSLSWRRNLIDAIWKIIRNKNASCWFWNVRLFSYRPDGQVSISNFKKSNIFRRSSWFDCLNLMVVLITSWLTDALYCSMPTEWQARHSVSQRSI